jgi:hypothetical protein
VVFAGKVTVKAKPYMFITIKEVKKYEVLGRN